MTCVQLTILSTQSNKFLDLFVGVLKFYLNGGGPWILVILKLFLGTLYFFGKRYNIYIF